MKKIRNLSGVFLFTASGILVSCSDSPTESGIKYPPDNQNKVTISQGVWGNVWFWEGNFMPSTDNSFHGTVTPVIREIYIYEATRYDSVVTAYGYGGFYTNILTKQIAKVQSDNTGFFQISLSPGKYSFFIKEDSTYYANGSDSEGHILPAVVTMNTITKRQIDIDYKAAY